MKKCASFTPKLNAIWNTYFYRIRIKLKLVSRIVVDKIGMLELLFHSDLVITVKEMSDVWAPVFFVSAIYTFYMPTC